MSKITPEQKLLDVIKKAQAKMKLKKDLKIFTRVNVLLVGVIIVVSAIFLVDMLTSGYENRDLKIQFPEIEEIVIPQKKPYYEDLGKDIYAVAVEEPLVISEDLIKDVTLLGIITGDEDQAIIEDKAAGKNYFLYKGDRFKEFTVYDIRENKVVLDYKGKKIELNI